MKDNDKTVSISEASAQIGKAVGENGAYLILVSVSDGSNDATTGCYGRGNREKLVELLTTFGLHSDIERSILAEALRNTMIVSNNKKFDA